MNPRITNENTACDQYRNLLREYSCLLFKPQSCEARVKDLSAHLLANCEKQSQAKAKQEEMELKESRDLLREHGHEYWRVWPR